MHKNIRWDVKSIINQLTTMLVPFSVSAFGLIPDIWNKIPIEDKSFPFGTLKQFLFSFAQKGKIQKDIIILVISVFGLTIIILWLRQLIKLYRKPGLTLIEHSTMTDMAFKTDQAEINTFTVTKIPYTNTFSKNLTSNRLENEVMQQISNHKSFAIEVLKRRKNDIIAYEGIAHIPFIFFLGFLIGDENETLLLHRFRELNCDTDIFRILKENPHDSFTCREDIINKPKEYVRNLVIIVPFSYEIKKESYHYIVSSDDYITQITPSEGYSRDLISTIQKARDAARKISEKAAMLRKDLNPEAIILFLATSSDFTFLLGANFSKQIHGRTIVYHYEAPSYQWGLEVTEEKLIKSQEI